MTRVLRQTTADTEWFTRDRFGLFIHWGIYALPARHEWVKQRERVRDEDYGKYFDHFYPDLYDPEKWAREARNAGMRYFVVTTKQAGRVEYAPLLNDASEIRMQVIDPDQQAQNTTMGGIPRGTLTLELPVQRPPVEVPVVELYLKA